MPLPTVYNAFNGAVHRRSHRFAITNFTVTDHCPMFNMEERRVLRPELNTLRLLAALLHWRREFSQVLRIELPSCNRFGV